MCDTIGVPVISAYLDCTQCVRAGFTRPHVVAYWIVFLVLTRATSITTPLRVRHVFAW